MLINMFMLKSFIPKWKRTGTRFFLSEHRPATCTTWLEQGVTKDISRPNLLLEGTTFTLKFRMNDSHGGCFFFLIFAFLGAETKGWETSLAWLWKRHFFQQFFQAWTMSSWQIWCWIFWLLVEIPRPKPCHGACFCSCNILMLKNESCRTGMEISWQVPFEILLSKVVLPRKVTFPLKNDGWKMDIFLLKMVPFRGTFVNFWEGIYS